MTVKIPEPEGMVQLREALRYPPLLERQYPQLLHSETWRAMRATLEFSYEAMVREYDLRKEHINDVS